MTVLIAKKQTDGKGRLNRKWHSKKDLTFSILIKDNLRDDYPKLSMVVATCLYKTLSKKVNVMIKWPNDIVYCEKKLAGILLESKTEETLKCVVIGCGINTNTSFFKREIKDKAISLRKILKRKIDNESLLNDFLTNFIEEYNRYINDNNDYIKVINDNLSIKGKRVIINNINEEKSVTAMKVLENGNLLISDNGKEKELFSGEVTLNKNY